MYFPTHFPLAEKIKEHRPDLPKQVGLSVTIHFGWVDVFGNQVSDLASFAGVAEEIKGHRKRHPFDTSTWACHLYPIEKGKLWTGIAGARFQSPPKWQSRATAKPDAASAARAHTARAPSHHPPG